MVIYKKELILNVTVFVVRVWRIAIYRGNDTEFFLFVSGRRENGDDLILNVMFFCVFLAHNNIEITDVECYTVCLRCRWRGI